MNPTIKIVNATTGEEIVREMNKDELAEYQRNEASVAARKEAETSAATAKAALLTRLGITEEEAKLLLS
jgi:hypothetical protein